MRSTHTPGPWTVSALDGRTCGPSRLLVMAGGGVVPQLQAVAIVTLRTNETDANARLIAAAPELLTACKTLDDASHQEHFACRLNDEEMTALKAIRAAVAKAEGR